MSEWTLYDATNLLALALYRLDYAERYQTDPADVVFSNGTEHEIYQNRAGTMLGAAPMLWRALRDGLRDDDAVLMEYAGVMAAGDRKTINELDRAQRS